MTRRWLWLVPGAFFGLLFAWPLVTILGKGFGQAWVHDLFDAHTISIIWFTIWQALASTVICLALGIPGAYLLYRKRFFGQRVIRALITIPFMLPTIVVATAFTVFQNRNTDAVTLIIIAHVFINYSLAVRTIGSHWSILDKSIDEAAALGGAGRLRIAWSISLPQLRGSIVSAGATIFMYCAASYGIILVLGGGNVHTLETDIANTAIGLLDLPRTAALALIQTAITITAFAISERANRRVTAFDDVSDDASKERVDARDWPAVAITSTIVMGLLVVPMWDIFVHAFDNLSNFTALASKGTRDVLNISVVDAMVNSARNLVISTSLALVVGTMIAWLLVHTKLGRFKSIIDVILLLPLGISTVVLGFGYLITFTPSSIPLREYWIVVPLIQSVLAVPLVTRIVYPSIASLGRVQIESAATEGATAWQIWRYVEAPQMRHTLATAAAFAGLVSIGEFGAASLLAFGDQATLPTVLYSLISRPGGSNYGMAMAVSVILILFTFLVVWVVSSGTPRRRRRQRSARA